VLGLGLGACTSLDESIGDAIRSQQFPPQRVLFASLSPEDAQRHGTAVTTALEAPEEDVSLDWTGATPAVAGSVTVLGTYRHTSGLVCSRVRDVLSIADDSETATDLACWSDGRWVWARDGGPSPPVVP
jgi:surface antigen